MIQFSFFQEMVIHGLEEEVFQQPDLFCQKTVTLRKTNMAFRIPNG